MTQARAYTLDSNKAISGSTTGYQRITESGGYVGVFTRAKFLLASTGATGIEFTFEDSQGREASYLNVYTHNRTGGETYGLEQLNALLACMKLRECQPQSANIKEYDHASKKEQQVQAALYPALMNVPVGVVLQREEYRKGDGGLGERMQLVGFFNAETRQSGREIMTKTLPAVDIDALLKTLKDKTMTDTAVSNSPVSTAAQPATAASTLAPDFDDDIPF